MHKRNIVPPGDVNRLAKCVMDLVTGNPIVEDISPIRKDKDPAFPLGQFDRESRSKSMILPAKHAKNRE